MNEDIFKYWLIEITYSLHVILLPSHLFFISVDCKITLIEWQKENVVYHFLFELIPKNVCIALERKLYIYLSLGCNY